MKKSIYKIFIIYFLLNILFFQNVKAEENTTGVIEISTMEKRDISDLEIKECSYKKFLDMIELNNIENLYYNKNSSMMYAEDSSGNFHSIMNPEYETFKKDMLEKGISVLDRNILKTDKDKEAEESSEKAIWLFIIIIVFIVGFCIYINKTQTNKITFIKKKSKITLGTPKDDSTTSKSINPAAKTFDDVAGLEEVKKDMECLVDFLKNADKYKSAGAKLPKGVILYGPPGTGKTLIAKAVAGEANVPFMYMSGSDFIEMYVGVGAKRVRELFEKAKKNAPCIVFIDEIDAIGGKRNGYDSSGEDRKTINALLTEMDGFNSSENILVIGATNRIDDLDPALVRPGRFSNKYCVPLPSSSNERLEIIKLYSKNKKFSENVDFDGLAKETIGFSPAQIESLMNESAIISVQDRKNFIDRESIDKAMFKILLSGHVKDNQKDRDTEELKLVAWHEAGHALIGKIYGKEVSKVTILSSTSGAGGVTFTTPTKMGLQSVEDLKNEVKELYGGRVAEFLLYKDKEKVTTGASNDIERATNIIKEIISTYGMTDSFGLLNLSQLKIDEKIIIQEEINLAKQLEKETYKILETNLDKLEKIATSLLEKETLYEKDLDFIIFGKEEREENSENS